MGSKGAAQFGGPGRLPVILTLALFACGPSTLEAAVEITSFERSPCTADPKPGYECYLLQVQIVGSAPDSPGRCDVVAVAKDGSDMEQRFEMNRLELELGGKYGQLFELPKIDDPNFDRWEPTCEPQGEG